MKPAQYIQRHIDIRLGLGRVHDLQTAFSNEGLGEQKSGDKLAGNRACNGISASLQFSGAADGIECGAGEGTTHPFHFLPQRRKRSLGKPTFHHEGGINAQRADDGQKKP